MAIAALVENFKRLEAQVKDMSEGRAVVPGVPAVSTVTATSEAFKSDTARDKLRVIVNEWVMAMPSDSVVQTKTVPMERSKLPYTHLFPRLVEGKAVKLPVRKALFEAMGLDETNQAYLDAFDEAYDHKVVVNKKKKKGEDDMPGAGVLQRFRKLRRGVKSNRIGKNMKIFVDNLELTQLKYPGGWRKEIQGSTRGCFFFDDESAAALFDGIYSNPRIEAFDRVLSLCQVGVLDQMVCAKLSGTTSKAQNSEGYDAGFDEKTALIVSEVLSAVESNGWDVADLAKKGCLCSCCYVVELGGFPRQDRADEYDAPADDVNPQSTGEQTSFLDDGDDIEPEQIEVHDSGVGNDQDDLEANPEEHDQDDEELIGSGEELGRAEQNESDEVPEEANAQNDGQAQFSAEADAEEEE